MFSATDPSRSPATANWIERPITTDTKENIICAIMNISDRLPDIDVTLFAKCI